MKREYIEIFGAREHNLQGVDVRLPKRAFVVLTGVSGSGKSSLAFDTLYAEGQRRYVESLSAYARQFLGQMDKPRYDTIRGLTPTISIEQKTTNTNPRSTVGTITEISDYLRLLFARCGTQHCVRCGGPVQASSAEQIAQEIAQSPAGTRLTLLAPVLTNRKGEHRGLLAELRAAGHVRLRVDGETLRTEEVETLAKTKKHNVEVVVDRVVAGKTALSRITEATESALRLGRGTLLVATEGAVDLTFNEAASCCGTSYPALSPAGFSFNSPLGMCLDCNGIGRMMAVVPEKVMPDDGLSIDQGAIASWGPGVSKKTGWAGFRAQFMAALKIPLDVPLKRLTERQRKQLVWGTGDKVYPLKWKGRASEGSWSSAWEGVVPTLQRRFSQTKSERARKWYTQFMSDTPCRTCGGGRLRPESAAVQVGGKGLVAVSELTVASAEQFFSELKLQGGKGQVAREVLKEIRARLGFLSGIGLGYLSLDRSGPSLSGGEAQRIRLASQVGSELTGVTYVLDEPSIGLHPRDNSRLLQTLLSMRDVGNTVVAVEHDEDTIRAADYVVDFGPGAGVRGGQVVHAGSPESLLAANDSLTGAYLSGRKSIEPPATVRAPSGWLKLVGARHHNLKNLTVKLPLGVLCAVTGVSGAGKSTLIGDILYPALAHHYHRAESSPGAHKRVEGLEGLDKVVNIDQRPIGRTPRSNPATYVKIFDEIRAFFARLPLSKTRGYAAGRFSFNVKGGRCEDCQGDGVRKIEMHFLADVYVPCEACGGRRFNAATLEVQFKGRSIADVLELSVAEAIALFEAHPKIAGPLTLLSEVGLDYLALGQASNTLSGGEAQRIKLARELSRKATGRTLYILDEPTTGLHFEDVVQLLGVLQRLVDAGNSVLVIEHHLDVIRSADWIVDMGPEGGPEGGLVVASGPPESVAATPGSLTGACLQAHTARAVKRARTGRGARPAANRKKVARAKGSEPRRASP